MSERYPFPATRRSAARSLSAIALASTVLAACSTSDGAAPRDGGVTIRDEALLAVGADGDGAWILPNGRRITPAGRTSPLEHFPLAFAWSPDRGTLFAASDSAVAALDPESGAARATVSVPGAFFGLAVSHDGATVYAARSGDELVVALAWDGATLTERAQFPVGGYPSGLAISPDDAVLWVALEIGGQLVALDARTGARLGGADTGGNPYAVVLAPDGREAYVSVEREGQVRIFDVSDPRAPRKVAGVAVQKNPEALALSADGSVLLVANSDEDSISVLDLPRRRVRATIDLRPLGAAGYGSAPNALALAPDGGRVYVAQAADNAVRVIDLASARVVGAIPTAWYPTALALSSDGRRLHVANAKGVGSGPNGPTVTLSNASLLEIVDVPSDAELAADETRVREHNTRSARLFDVNAEAFANPVPLERGGATPIEHVLFVIRENKTYDALLGDFAGANGVAENCLYCGDATPNLHALVERFASGDNYYSNAEASVQGHALTTGAISNAFTEKNWFGDRGVSRDLEQFANASEWPKKQFLFQALLAKGIPFKSYGDQAGLGPDLLVLDRQHVHWGPKDPPLFWLNSKDDAKIDERIAEWERDGLPTVAYMGLPNDHTSGCEFPYPTPISMVADNDFATGKLIDWLSHSRYWESSLVVVIEDDPQQGVDHVDAHRSILLVASPWVKRGYVSHVQYHEGNLHATFGHILGLEPLTIYDENAQPAWDLFTSTPDLTPFTAVPRKIPEETSMPGTNCGTESRGLDFLDPDEADGLQRILWAHERDGLNAFEREKARGASSGLDALDALEALARGAGTPS